jgi:hypothetical protein
MSSDPKSRLYEQLVRVGTALASAGRLKLLEFVAQGGRSVAAMRKRGLRARRLENGFPEWRAAGLPVER